MPSAIDPTKPVAGTPTTDSVRQNFATAKTEIEALQSSVAVANQSQSVTCYNGSGATITKGQVVYIAGAQGQRPDIRLARANTEATSTKTFGVAAATIANGAEGEVRVSGVLADLDTSALTEGGILWLSPTTAGAYTHTKPSAPNHLVLVGWCVRSHATAGQILVHVENGYEIDELHDVLVTTPAAGHLLIYDATVGVWKNATLTAGVGISITNADGSITISTGSTINAQTGTTYTFAAADSTRFSTFSNAAAITVTIPANSTVAYPLNTELSFAQIGAGQVTVVGASGVTVNATPGLKCRAQYSGATAKKLGTDTWILVGDLAA